MFSSSRSNGIRTEKLLIESPREKNLTMDMNTISSKESIEVTLDRGGNGYTTVEVDDGVSIDGRKRCCEFLRFKDNFKAKGIATVCIKLAVYVCRIEKFTLVNMTQFLFFSARNRTRRLGDVKYFYLDISNISRI